MLVLSILIVLALAVAVASFFIASAQWLLLASAAFVLAAFYLSRRASRNISDFDAGATLSSGPAARTRASVTVDQQMLDSVRHRDTFATTDDGGPAPAPQAQNDSSDAAATEQQQPESGRIAS